MAAGNVWFGNRAWPSGRSPGDFAGDIFRLEGCRSDKEKALAFYGWCHKWPRRHLARAKFKRF